MLASTVPLYDIPRLHHHRIGEALHQCRINGRSYADWLHRMAVSGVPRFMRCSIIIWTIELSFCDGYTRSRADKETEPLQHPWQAVPRTRKDKSSVHKMYCHDSTLFSPFILQLQLQDALPSADMTPLNALHRMTKLPKRLPLL